ncbi:stress responsive a b barrel domain containing protein [Grosmannia clavigera kw1407]|uniref:Stress responsive a b barrel domain containing protein n=1 Tax=Grosmannia clavigera (strain kw1407 / UAMH 11150) TaxID=655863 RepID=F0XS44_GROCL|nr:stress responsive a b barrel domain containing protein [Grosmannia clavigera kw1407]EFW99412.1 stress responsive a b barrel domain containing protein [Grosmannia clavigera kw1407]
MSVTHTVLVRFKDELKAEEVKTVPYILSLKGGKDNSPIGLQGGITHGFVVEFASVEDRDYYAKTDPVHMAFATILDSFVTKIIVVDFVSEEY